MPNSTRGRAKAAPSKKYEQTTMTRQELLELPVSFDIVTGGRAFSIGESKARQLARDGDFPCRVLRVGREYRVTRADLFRALGITENDEDSPEPGLDLAESA